ncbi:MAG: hypothetical protein ACREIF_02910 [Chthoniobacterales bacterium]
MATIFLPTCSRSLARAILFLFCAISFAIVPVRADDGTDQQSSTDAKKVAGETAAEEPQYNNWIELGIGGNIIHGDAAQFKQEHRLSGDVFGGIQDLHYEQTIGKDVQFSLDGHAIFDNQDYGLTLSLTKPGLGYIRGGFSEFRTWYDGNGGYFPVNGQFFPPPIPEMHIDRGEAWIELGLRIPNWPEITLRYSHEFRDGEKDSTSWGDTTLTGLTTGQTARKIAPAYRDIDETRDIVALDILKTFGNTDIGLGMRYEHDDNNDSLQLERGAGQLPPVVPPPGSQRFITQQETDKLDLFSGHATTETRFSDSFWLTTGYSYTTLGSDLTGTRIYGTTYNSAYSDPISTLSSRDVGFLNLAGTAQVNEWVIDLNTMWLPVKDVTLLTSFRYTTENKESDAVYVSTTLRTIPPTPTAVSSFENFNTAAETMEMRYDGINNWLIYAGGDWQEQWGNIHESDLATGSPALSGIKNLDLLWQKYKVGFNWYPLDRLNFSGEYYHKILRYDNQSTADGQQLEYQEWNTDDVNIRMTWRPRIPPSLGTVALVSRYDFTTSSVVGQWGIDETPFLPEHTALITNHMITETVTWNPLARLYIQGDLSYVLNQTKTPANNIVLVPGAGPSVLNFKNDYWTVDASAGFVLNDKTDLRVDYTFYRADDYVNNALASLPYGAGTTEHTVSATATRQIARNVRLFLKYSYFTYNDQLSGGHNNYEAHSLYSGLQIRF